MICTGGVHPPPDLSCHHMPVSLTPTIRRPQHANLPSPQPAIAACRQTFALEQQGGATTQAASAAAVAAATQHYQQTHRQAAALYGRFGLATGAQSEPLTAVELPKCMVYSDAAATAAAEALLAESMRRGTMDNVTVIVMLLQWG